MSTAEKIVYRPERDGDAPGIHVVNAAAFERADEADLVDRIRESGGWQISIVAELDSTIVGHILFTEVTVESGETRVTGVGLAPMAVSPNVQRKGLGGQLIRAGLDACLGEGRSLVVVLGHPEYYPRFGFERADEHGIEYVDPVPPGALMVLALVDNALDGVRGVVRFRKEFDGS